MTNNIAEDDVDPEVIEEEQIGGATVRHKGVYLLPNLFTTASLFSGFYAIVAAINGNFESAAIAIFVSMILDGLDGRVARMTNTQSKFGAEYDSLADMVAFGVAPALVAFVFGLQELGKIGWIASFIYVAGAALRLARFNTQIDSVDSRYFIGLPSPSAAGVVAGIIWWLSIIWPENTVWRSTVTALIVASSGMLMVSNILFYSFKSFDFKGRVPFAAILVVVLIFAVVSLEPSLILLLIFLVYAFSGPVQAIFRVLRKKQEAKHIPEQPNVE